MSNRYTELSILMNLKNSYWKKKIIRILSTIIIISLVLKE